MTSERSVSSDPKAGGMVNALAAFENRNFRWYFAALVSSNVSMNIQVFIRGWIVYELTGSFADLGSVHLLHGLTGVLFSLLGGVVAERARQQKRVWQLGQIASGANAAVIAMLLATGQLQLWHVLVSAVIQGATQNLVMPARYAMVYDVVGEDRLTNAVVLNTLFLNVTRLLMPGLAGWVVGVLGGEQDIGAAQWVYYAMTLAYLASAGFLSVLSLPDRHTSPGKARIWADLRDGFRYIWVTPVIRMLLLVNFFMIWFALTYFQLLPGFAKEVLDSGPVELGILTSLTGVGAVIGGVVLALAPLRRRGLIVLLSGLAMGFCLLGFAASEDYWLSAGLILMVGVAQSGRMSLANVLVQAHVDDAYRSRVMAVFTMEYSLTSIGTYAIAIAADQVGPQWAVGVSAVALVLLCVGLLFFAPSYRRLD